MCFVQSSAGSSLPRQVFHCSLWTLICSTRNEPTILLFCYRVFLQAQSVHEKHGQGPRQHEGQALSFRISKSRVHRFFNPILLVLNFASIWVSGSSCRQPEMEGNAWELTVDLRGSGKCGHKILLETPPAGSVLPLRFRRLEVSRFGYNLIRLVQGVSYVFLQKYHLTIFLIFKFKHFLLISLGRHCPRYRMEKTNI